MFLRLVFHGLDDFATRSPDFLHDRVSTQAPRLGTPREGVRGCAGDLPALLQRLVVQVREIVEFTRRRADGPDA
jgi:hypothetical protein